MSRTQVRPELPIQASVAVLAIALLASPVVPAKHVAAQEEMSMVEQLYGELSYRSVGPSRGGRVTAVAGHPAHPFTFYMGATGGGVWKTEDYGNTWYPISDGYFETGSIGSIRVAPSDPNVVYVGTGSDRDLAWSRLTEGVSGCTVSPDGVWLYHDIVFNTLDANDEGDVFFLVVRRRTSNGRGLEVIDDGVSTRRPRGPITFTPDGGAFVYRRLDRGVSHMILADATTGREQRNLSRSGQEVHDDVGPAIRN